jgi:uncharacterized membrane protein YdjX (TVP38/TMEM64 family)
MLKERWISWLCLGLFGAAAGGFLVFGHATDWSILDVLGDYDRVRQIIDDRYALALAGFAAAVFIVVMLGLPLTATMDVIGGLLFGLPGYVVALTSIGFASMIPFLIARNTLGDVATRVRLPLLDRIRDLCADRPVLFVTVLRMLPIAPFPVLTVALGSLRIGSGAFFVGNILGFLPPGLALNMVGQNLRGMAGMDAITVLQILRQPEFWIMTTLVLLFVILPGAVVRLAKGRQGLS